MCINPKFHKMSRTSKKICLIYSSFSSSSKSVMVACLFQNLLKTIKLLNLNLFPKFSMLTNANHFKAKRLIQCLNVRTPLEIIHIRSYSQIIFQFIAIVDGKK